MKWLILFSFFSLCTKPSAERFIPHLTDKTWIADSARYSGSDVYIPESGGIGFFSFHLYKGGSDSTPCDSLTGACPTDWDNGYPNKFYFKLYGNTLYVKSTPFVDTSELKFEYSDLTNNSVTMTYLSFGEKDTFWMSSY